MKIHIYRDVTRQYRFRVVARNGRIVANGEGYKRRQGCVNAIRALRRGVNNAIVVSEK